MDKKVNIPQHSDFKPPVAIYYPSNSSRNRQHLDNNFPPSNYHHSLGNSMSKNTMDSGSNNPNYSDNLSQTKNDLAKNDLANSHLSVEAVIHGNNQNEHLICNDELPRPHTIKYTKKQTSIIENSKTNDADYSLKKDIHNTLFQCQDHL